MPIQLRVMSWNIQKKQTNAPYIAELMRVHRIDVCALLEVPNSVSDTIPQQIIVALDNLATAYHQHEWLYTSVNVGDEAVTFLWHQNATVGPNAFVGETCANDATKFLAGKVMKDATNNTIYFPTTNFNWSSLPGSPNGRRPAFMTFLTNDGGAVRRFTVLDLHTPFNPFSSIQSYSAALYASAREISSVETVNALAAVETAAAAALPGALPASVGTQLTGITSLTIVPMQVWNRAVAAAYDAITDALTTRGASPATLLPLAAEAGVTGALAGVGGIPGATPYADADDLAQACAIVAVRVAITLVAAIQLPTAPPPATVSAASAAAEGDNLVRGQGSAYTHPPGSNGSRIKRCVTLEARRLAQVATAAFTFPAIPQVAVNGAVVAGDFNVSFPDTTSYLPSQQNFLGVGGNAYTRLTAVAAATAQNQATTRAGPISFGRQGVFTLRTPCPIQHTNTAAPDYVPLDVSPLVATPVSFIGFYALKAHLQTLPRVGGISWAALEKTYWTQIFTAFDTLVINDTAFYRANCYDNMFVRAATVVGGQARMIDVLSELGSWPGYTVNNPSPATGPEALTANPWPAATRGLNATAAAYLATLPAPITFTYQWVNYTLTPALGDATQATVFYDQMISDHLPVFVEIRI